MEKENRKALYGGQVIYGEQNIQELFGNLDNKYQRFVVLVGKDQDYISKHILSILCLEKDVYDDSDDDVKKLGIDSRYNRDDYYVTISPIYKHMLDEKMKAFDLEYIEKYLSSKYTFFREHELIELFIDSRDVNTLVRFTALKQHLMLDDKKFDELMKELYKNDKKNMNEYEYYKELIQVLNK